MIKPRHLLAILLPLLVTACGPQFGGHSEPGQVWSGGDWWVARTANANGFLCVASRRDFDHRIAFTQPRLGPVGWRVHDQIGQSRPGQIYPITMVFSPSGTLRFTGTPREQRELYNSELDPVTAGRLAQFAASAESLAVSSRNLGGVDGFYRMDGSAAAIAALDRCAKGNI